MKLKQAITGIAALACMTRQPTRNRPAAFYVTTGWFHLAPQSSSDPLKETSVGGSPSTSPYPTPAPASISADTIGFTAGYFVTDHIATEFVIGVPPKFDLDGSGSLHLNSANSARQNSGARLCCSSTTSMTRNREFRPYLRRGCQPHVSFTDAEITNSVFEQHVLHGPTTVSTDSSWEPVFNAGFTYAIDQHWFAGFSLSYLPLSTTAKLNTAAATPVGTLNVPVADKDQAEPDRHLRQHRLPFLTPELRPR